MEKMWQMPNKIEDNSKKHPEQRDDEVFIGMYDAYDKDTGEFLEDQEEDDREKFEDLSWETKRSGSVTDGEYPVFVKREEYDKLNKE